MTGGDFEQDAEIEIINKSQYICTLDEGAKLDMDVTIGRGRGYRGAGSNKNQPIGYIPIDSIYTPVKKVNYNVENTRVGQSIDYDKLVMEVWTNGAFSAKEIVSLAAKIMQDHIGLFVNLSDSIKGMDILVKNEDGQAAGARHGDRGTWTSPSVPTTASSARTSTRSKISPKRPRTKCSKCATSAESRWTRSYSKLESYGLSLEKKGGLTVCRAN